MTVSRRQNYPGPARQTLRRLAPSRQPLQLAPCQAVFEDGSASRASTTSSSRTGAAYSFWMTAADSLCSAWMISEIAVLGLPAVLIPYPHHRDRHQFFNARAYAEAGAGCVIEEGDLNAESLGDIVRNILFVRGRLDRMAQCARGLARPDAADSVVDLAVELRESCQPAFASFS